MAKNIGKGPPPTLLTPTALPTARTGRTHQVRTKAPVTSPLTSAIDATEAAAAEQRPDTAPLKHQVRAGMLKLEQAYYGQEPGEPSFLKLMAPAGAEPAGQVADHVLAHQSKLFAKDLGLTQEESRALVADLALVLA